MRASNAGLVREGHGSVPQEAENIHNSVSIPVYAWGGIVTEYKKETTSRSAGQ
ncbi:hypothetical protein R1sor_004485 [Riccia sorocarpa]|uniref:Uncharacterized protein n=1 Tax=Riccia sorocarpa TaxID=122646 RepID=A0ABD3HKU4_9MARC